MDRKEPRKIGLKVTFFKEKILITGGSGLFALNYAAALRNKKSILLGLHQRKIKVDSVNAAKIPKSKEAFRKFLLNEEVTTVIHAAGLTDVEACESQPDLATRVNCQLAGALAGECADLGVGFVHISTDHLFSGTKSFVNEEEQIEPLNIYAKTKADAERLVFYQNPNSLVIRTNFFGWGTTYRHSFSDVIIQSLRDGRPLDLFDDVFFSPILATELAATISELQERKASGIFHVCADNRLSKYDFGLALADAFGFDKSLLKRIHFNDRHELTNRPLDMSLSNEKVRKLLGRPLGNVEYFIDVLKRQSETGIAKELGKL